MQLASAILPKLDLLLRCSTHLVMPTDRILNTASLKCAHVYLLWIVTPCHRHLRCCWRCCSCPSGRNMLTAHCRSGMCHMSSPIADGVGSKLQRTLDTLLAWISTLISFIWAASRNGCDNVWSTTLHTCMKTPKALGGTASNNLAKENSSLASRCIQSCETCFCNSSAGAQPRQEMAARSDCLPRVLNVSRKSPGSTPTHHFFWWSVATGFRKQKRHGVSLQ